MKMRSHCFPLRKICLCHACNENPSVWQNHKHMIDTQNTHLFYTNSLLTPDFNLDSSTYNIHSTFDSEQIRIAYYETTNHNKAPYRKIIPFLSNSGNPHIRSCSMRFLAEKTINDQVHARLRCSTDIWLSVGQNRCVLMALVEPHISRFPPHMKACRQVFSTQPSWTHLLSGCGFILL